MGYSCADCGSAILEYQLVLGFTQSRARKVSIFSVSIKNFGDIVAWLFPPLGSCRDCLVPVFHNDPEAISRPGPIKYSSCLALGNLGPASGSTHGVVTAEVLQAGTGIFMQ